MIEFFLQGEFLQLVCSQTGDAILAQLQALPAPSFPQGDIMLFAPGEILKQRAKGVVLHHPQVNL